MTLRLDQLPPKIRDWPRTDRATLRRSTSQLLEAAQAGDVTAFWEAINDLEMVQLRPGIPYAFLRLPRIGKAHPDIQRSVLEAWQRDSFRGSVDDDRALIAGLRALLPAYTGPAIRLYRGDSAWNHRRRSYGLSWSSARGIAEQHAQNGMYRTFDRGSVLLETDAPPDAVICHVPSHLEDTIEDEFLIDRRKLGRVRVVERYSQVPLGPAPTAPATVAPCIRVR